MIVYTGYGHSITKPKSVRAVMQHNSYVVQPLSMGRPCAGFCQAGGLQEKAAPGARHGRTPMKGQIISTLFFYFFAILTLGSAFFVVYLNNIMRAALSLLFSLIGVAALYALMAADFLAAAQVLIYVAAS
jgi:hypothetical protein